MFILGKGSDIFFSFIKKLIKVKKSVTSFESPFFKLLNNHSSFNKLKKGKEERIKKREINKREQRTKNKEKKEKRKKR